MTVPVAVHVLEAAARVRTNLPRHVVERALALYDAGWPPLRIERETAVSRSTFHGWRKQSGLPINADARSQPRLPDDVVARTVELYRSGLSIDEVAARLGVSANSVQWRLQSAGVRRRARGGSPEARRPPLPDGWLTASDAARRIGCTRTHVSRLAANGRIEGARRHEWRGANLWIVPVGEVERLRSAFRPRLRSVPSVAGGESTPVALAGGPDTWLPAGPLGEWIEQTGLSVKELHRQTGVPERRLYEVRENRQQHVTLTVADRLLTAMDARLDDVWPDLDELLAVAA